jgi:hypothetical protein
LLASLGVGVLEALQQHPSAQAETHLRVAIDEALQLCRDGPVPVLPGRQALHSDFNLTTYTSDGIAKRTPARMLCKHVAAVVTVMPTASYVCRRSNAG